MQTNPKTDEVTVTLKPCPFCGGEAERIKYQADSAWNGDHAECKKCGANTFLSDWNTRASEQSPAAAASGELVAVAIDALRHWNEQALAWLSTRYDHAKPGWMEPAIAKGTAAIRALTQGSAPASAEVVEGLFDAEPQVVELASGPEPSLRAMVRYYYASHSLNTALIDRQTAEYFAALSQPPAPATQADERMVEALEPFASFAATNVDAEGWNLPVSVHKDRIVDWFGPSDFRRAQMAYAALKQSEATAPDGGGWDHRYRRLEWGEIIQEGDECQNDDGTWKLGICVGQRAPDPNYTSHRVYRRLKATTGAEDRDDTSKGEG